MKYYFKYWYWFSWTIYGSKIGASFEFPESLWSSHILVPKFMVWFLDGFLYCFAVVPSFNIGSQMIQSSQPATLPTSGKVWRNSPPTSITILEHLLELFLNFKAFHREDFPNGHLGSYSSVPMAKFWNISPQGQTPCSCLPVIRSCGSLKAL